MNFHRYNKTELREYEDSLKAYRDIKNSLDTAKEEGRAEGIEEGLAKGRAEGCAEVAKKLLSMGLSLKDVAEATGLAMNEVEQIASK